MRYLDPNFKIDQEFIIVMTIIAVSFITAWRMVSCAVTNGI